MDYGHTDPQGFGPQRIEGQDFFTAGVGNNPASENAPSGAENLNLDQNPWNYAPEHDNGAIGNKVISSPEAFMPAAPQAQPEFGKIISVNPQSSTAPVANDQAKIYNTAVIRTSGDHLDKEAVAEIKKIEDKLSQDGDLNSFYNEARELTSVNLKNSYNRDLENAAVIPAQGEKVA